MTFLLDMNLSPAWCSVLKTAGIDSVHWSEKGNYKAPDTEIFNFAAEHGFTIVTCDMDFTAILALTGAEKPSVVLIRAKNIAPDFFARTLIAALKNNYEILESGAIIVIDDEKERVRVLPLRNN